MSSDLPDGAPTVRLCHLCKWPDFDGFGFNLHAERGKAGQFIGKIDDTSPASTAGLLEGDRIIEVDGVNIGNENHKQVVGRIKKGGGETRLLVVDSKVDDWYKEHKVVIRGDLSSVVSKKSPPSKAEATSEEKITAPPTVLANDETGEPLTNGEIAAVAQEETVTQKEVEEVHTEPPSEQPPENGLDSSELELPPPPQELIGEPEELPTTESDPPVLVAPPSIVIDEDQSESTVVETPPVDESSQSDDEQPEDLYDTADTVRAVSAMREEVVADEHDEEPERVETPPPREPTPPPVEDAAPVDDTPVPREATPPPREETPPPRVETPPPREPTPPPREPTPPPREPTPPPREPTPPPREPTPPPAEPEPQPVKAAAPPVPEEPKSNGVSNDPFPKMSAAQMKEMLKQKKKSDVKSKAMSLQAKHEMYMRL